MKKAGGGGGYENVTHIFIEFLFRGRFIKRVFYTTIGAGIGASISYPAEAKQLSDEAYTETRKKAMIAYNFVNGGINTKSQIKMHEGIKVFHPIIMEENE